MSKEVWGYHEHPKRREPEWVVHPQTSAVREGLARSGFGETSEALYLNSGFTYTDSQEAVDAFTDQTDHFLYSRFHNPTVAMFEKRLAAIEGAEHCVATASGMAAMFASLACILEAGDHIVASAAMFSSCHVVITEILPKWGVTYELVKANDKAGWEKALAKKVKAVFIETPSNPLLEIVDIRFVSDLAHKVGATVIVDNVMASPVLQKPLELGADVVMYSATKHIDGQGRVLAGAILGSFSYIYEKLIPFVRHTGPTLSAFNAWVLVKSLETMGLRVSRMSESAQAIAEFLEGHPKIKSVRYPGLPSHPDFGLAKKQMSAGGTTIGIEFVGSQREAFTFMDALCVIDISNNLGDSKSRLSPEDQLKMGITPSVLRLSVGLEHVGDLIKDLDQALSN